MSLELCILASGSSGNAALLRSPAGCVLIDAGIGPRTLGRRLDGTGVCLAEISAIVLTHLDHDHFNPSWLRTILNRGIRVYVHAHRAEELVERLSERWPGVDVGEIKAQIHRFNGRAFAPLPDVRFHPISLAHDLEGSHGFVIEGFGARIGYATDLGRVPDHLFGHFRDLDVLALESNYDVQMQLGSGRPWFLKNRIMGGAGHLSNDQALAAIQKILDHSESCGARLPAHIVLLHRSRECNCPDLVRRFFAKDRRIAARLALAHPFERTEWLGASSVRSPRTNEQLTMAWR